MKRDAVASKLLVRKCSVWRKKRDVLLLDEALDLMDASEVICLLPCACKTLLRPGSPVIEGSMRVGARARETLEIGQGRGLTPDEAKQHLHRPLPLWCPLP